MWSDIIGQERVKEILANIYGSGKISHAYLFYGNEGTGKDAAAFEFGKLLNCESPDIVRGACNECRSCRETDSLKSALFRYIFALPTGKNETDEDFNPVEKLEKEDFVVYLSEIENKTFDKYHKINIPGANDIRISSIRQIKKEIYMTGRTGKKKIFVISKCDMMNQNSANSLLKILEEPPKDSILILTTSKINSLLPTIIGRCQKIKFDNIDKELLKKFVLDSDDSIPDNVAGFYADLSEGSITKCRDILDNNYLELREKVIDLLTFILTNQNLKLGNEIDSITGKKDKQRIRQFLVLLNVWFRDIISMTNGNAALIINKDKTDRIKKFVANFSSDNYSIINKIEEAVKDIDSNIFPDLILHNLAFNIKSLIQKRNQ